MTVPAAVRDMASRAGARGSTASFVAERAHAASPQPSMPESSLLPDLRGVLLCVSGCTMVRVAEGLGGRSLSADASDSDPRGRSTSFRRLPKRVPKLPEQCIQSVDHGVVTPKSPALPAPRRPWPMCSSRRCSREEAHSLPMARPAPPLRPPA